MFGQRTVARNSISISIKPAIAPPQHPIEAWQTKDCVERPCPPDSSRHAQVCVSSRFQFSGVGQYPYVVQQILLRNLQAAVGGCGLQVLNGEAPVQLLSSRSEPNENRTRIRHRRVSSLRAGGRILICALPVSLDSIAPEDDDWGAVCHERGGWSSSNNSSEFAPVKSAGVPFKSR